VHHIRQGSGPPLVLIPGTACDHRVWRPVLGALSARREVIALDLPGFGATPPLAAGPPSGEAATPASGPTPSGAAAPGAMPPPAERPTPGEAATPASGPTPSGAAAPGAMPPPAERPTPAVLAAAVADFLDELGLERPAVAGSSLGAAIAVELVRMGRARSACAVAPIGLWTPREAAWVQAFVKASAVFIRGPRAVQETIADHALLRTLGYGFVVARPWALRPTDARAMADVAIPGFEAIVDAYRDYRLPAFDGADVTVVWGTRDRLLLPRQANRVPRVLPQARVVRLAGAGHLPMFDAPERVAEVILGGE
jgi:pimeloyl-ACP methyl ester carboxylesterase